MLYPKPTPRRVEKSRRRAHVRQQRASCVEAVWARADSRCEVCGVWLLRAREAGSPFHVGHVHEQKPRSLGGSATDPANCVLMCPRCHLEAHRLRVAGATLTPRHLIGG